MTATSALPFCLNVPLTDEFLTVVAERVVRLLAERPSDATSPWLTAVEAAGYIRAPISRIYALVSASRIPFYKDSSRLLFHRDELDSWLRAGGAKRP